VIQSHCFINAFHAPCIFYFLRVIFLTPCRNVIVLFNPNELNLKLLTMRAMFCKVSLVILIELNT
jgi:hypothetical protein